MADVFSKTKRSEVMSKIRAKGNKGTEMVLMRLLRINRISGWRRHVVLKFDAEKIKYLKISKRESFSWKPYALVDFVFQQEKVAIFVDGCFWHGCLKHSNRPANNRIFWKKKLKRNEARDQWVNKMLRLHGWRVVRIWEHELEQPLKKRVIRERRIVDRIQKAKEPRNRR